jgi:putative heme-binding domain-containing protein
LLDRAGNPNLSSAERAALFAALREIGGAPVIAGLERLSADSRATSAQRDAVLTLAALDLRAAMPAVVATLAATNENDAEPLWRALLGIRGAATRLAAEIPNARLPRAVARAGLRPAREGNQNQPLVQALMKSAGLSLATVQLSAPEMQALAAEAVAKGDPARGERLFRRPELACTACHSIGGAGGKVGPDLSSIGASAPADYLVESLLYPSAKIKEGYHSVLLAKKNGQEFSGVIAREDVTQIVLRDASNREVAVATQDIAKRSDVGSLMPAGLMDTLLPDERLDLIKFLSELGKPGDYDAPNGGVARTWRLYLVTALNEPFGVERVVKADFRLAGWVPTLSLVNGTLPREAIDQAFASLANNRGLFAATECQSPAGGRVQFRVVGEATSAWLNGRRLSRQGREFVGEAKAGANALVLQLPDDAHGIKVTSDDVTFAATQDL